MRLGEDGSGPASPKWTPAGGSSIGDAAVQTQESDGANSGALGQRCGNEGRGRTASKGAALALTPAHSASLDNTGRRHPYRQYRSPALGRSALVSRCAGRTTLRRPSGLDGSCSNYPATPSPTDTAIPFPTKPAQAWWQGRIPVALRGVACHLRTRTAGIPLIKSQTRPYPPAVLISLRLSAKQKTACVWGHACERGRQQRQGCRCVPSRGIGSLCAGPR